jgi:hypothetical protein
MTGVPKRTVVVGRSDAELTVIVGRLLHPNTPFGARGRSVRCMHPARRCMNQQFAVFDSAVRGSTLPWRVAGV